MKGKLLLITGIIALSLLSCSKNDDEPEPPKPATEKDFIHLQTGNYWIYEFYKVDTTGTETLIPGTDSTYISGDTVINGKNYFIRVGNTFLPGQPPLRWYLRDSSGCLIYYSDSYPEKILFSPDNFTDILRSDSNSIYRTEFRMTGKDSVVSVPAGTFNTRSGRLTVFASDPAYPYGIRHYYYIYGENAGLIKYTYSYFDQPDHFEARLVRYH